jgi:hypothetical protein
MGERDDVLEADTPKTLHEEARSRLGVGLGPERLKPCREGHRGVEERKAYAPHLSLDGQRDAHDTPLVGDEDVAGASALPV